MKIPPPGPHLGHLLRQPREHHVALSSMADPKANILMKLSSVVLTFAARHSSDAQTRAAALILILLCLLTMIFAVYSLVPKVGLRLRRRGKADVREPNFNLLFLTDYLQLDYGEYLKAMEELMSEPSLTYEMQVREPYTLGRFLAAKKYHFLRLSDLAFLTGGFASGVVMIAGAL
ncbi:MAG: Pycsar system effector family protein [Candidatus Oleimicrobiaceae bacterium]